MKAHEARKKTEKELQNLLAEHRKRLVELRFHAVQGKIKNVSEIKKVKRIIARIETVLKEKIRST